MKPLPLPDMHQVGSHFTASAVVIANEHILLIDHKRIQAWVPPGGHLDDDELPHQAAVREVFEETGVEVEVMSPELPLTWDSDAFFLPSPLCMHAVHAVEKGEAVYHIDIAYLCRPVQREEALPALIETSEVKAARWVPLTQVGSLKLAKNVSEMVTYALSRLSL